MSVYRRGDVWWYNFTIGRERYRGSTGQTSKTAARKVEARERERAALGAADRDIPTLEAIAAQWFVSRAADKKSAKTTAQRLEIMLRLMGPDTLIVDVDSPEIEAAMQARRLEPIIRSGKATSRLPSNSTVNRDLIDTTLRPIMTYARKVKKLPVAEIDWSELRLSEPKERDRTYSKAEIDAWRNALPAWHREVFDFAARYGVRLKEAFFPLDCVDVEAGRISLRGRKNGKGHTFRLLPEDRRRIAALYSRAHGAKLATLWFREMKDGSLKAIRWRGFQSASRTALDAAGIADAKPVHDLRHHAGTTLVRRTGNLAAAKRLLGHDNIQSTMRYVHADDDDVFDAMCHAYGTNDVEEAETSTKSTAVSGT